MRKVIDTLKNGGVGVLPTDTLYGLVGSALSKKAVTRIYKLKQRVPNSPFLILISDVSDLKLFGVKMPEVPPRALRFWPGMVTVVLPCPTLSKGLSYLRPLNGTLAFRLPKLKWLGQLLKQTGPLVAPSCNTKAKPPAVTIKQAKAYFGKQVDFYFDKGLLQGQPSTIISLENGKTKVLRQGKVKLKNNN